MSDSELERVLEPYKLEGTKIQKIGANRITTHSSGGAATTNDVGSWDRERVVGEGGNGVVFVEKNTVTGSLRAVKMLTRGKESEQLREINAMLVVKQVSCNEVSDRIRFADCCSSTSSLSNSVPGTRMGIRGTFRWSTCQAAT